MDKATLKEKQNWISEMTGIIWSSKTISPEEKERLDKELISIVGKNITKNELEQKKQEILLKIETEQKKTVNEVANDLRNPQNLTNISSIKDISTLNRSNGEVITSFQRNDGSINIMDSSFSGNIEQVVDEVAKKNQNGDLNKVSLTDEAFKEMQRRQIPISMTDINKSGLTQRQIEGLMQTQKESDNLMINSEYQIMVDNNNRLTELRNNKSENSVSQHEQQSNAMVQEKPKVYTKIRSTKGFNDAAFVDAALLGAITFYAGVLGLCAIFSKM